jgi:hypothetical protein
MVVKVATRVGTAMETGRKTIETTVAATKSLLRKPWQKEYERAAIGERTRAGLHRAYRGGRHMGAIPYGYSTDEHGHLQIVPEEAAKVRRIIENVAEGSTLYAEAKRLNDIGHPAPGWRYGSGKRRPGSGIWSVPTVSKIVHQHAYSGTHEVKINGGADIIEQTVPAIVDAAFQERADHAHRE